MGTFNVIKTIKQIHPLDIALIKNGNFVNVYGKDAYIIAYLLKYKLNKKDNIFICGFPKNSLNKVICKLEENLINYLLINKSANYEVEEKEEFKSKNNYIEIYTKAKEQLSVKMRIDNIYTHLLKNIENNKIENKIKDIEKILNEV